MGQVIYFDDDDSILQRNAVLDVQWFVKEVVTLFTKLHKDKPGDKQTDKPFSVETLLLILSQQEGITSEQATYVLRSLHFIGFLVPFDEGWDASKNSWPPKHFLVPALLQKEFKGWKEDEAKHYWGRRLECSDKVSTLLPSGIFAMIQVRVRDGYKKTFDLGQGWVSFRENGIGVILCIGGVTNNWMDRQWVDIMLSVPRDEKRCIEADKMMKEMKELISEICYSCPRLRLREMVLHPDTAQQYVVQSHPVVLGDEDLVEPLEEILQEVETRGLDYRHPWRMESEVRECQVGDVLMPSELQEHINNWRTLCQEYQEEVAQVYNTRSIEDIATIPEFESQDMRNFATFFMSKLKEMASDIKADIGGVHVSLEEMKRTLREIQACIEESGKKILSSCSQILLKLNVPCPKYPYLVDEKNVISRYCTLVGKTVSLRYRCEHIQDGHLLSHGPKGVNFVLPHNWYLEHVEVLGPCIDMLFFAAKFATSFVPSAGAPVGVAMDFFRERLKETRRLCFESPLDKLQQPSCNQVENLYQFVKTKSPYQRDDIFIEEQFGLYPKTIQVDGVQRQIWVCVNHR